MTARLKFEIVGALLVLALAVGAGYWLGHRNPVKPEIIKLPGTVTGVPVPGPPGPATFKYFQSVVVDKEQTKAILAEMEAMRAKVNDLTETIAKLETHGGGELPQPLPEGAEVHFKDDRLKFDAVKNWADYALTQKYEVIQATGRKVDGSGIMDIKLFEVRGEKKYPATIDRVTHVYNDETRPHWYLSGTVQGGFTNGGPIVGLAWLKRGRTKAPADTRWAVGTVFAGKDGFGLSPVSFNVGPSLPGFTNIWISPALTWPYGVRAIQGARLGGAVTATF